jgi:DNA-binding response OmpR family regulator
VVSARGEVDDRILGLHSGADDYLVKPYDIGELLARVHAVYRRRRVVPAGGPAGPDDVVVIDDVSVDLHRHSVTVAGRPVNLTRKEFQVLALLASSGGAVCPRSRIVAEVWGRSWAGANRTLDVHVATLRTKLGRADLVQTVRGVGYRLGVPDNGSSFSGTE